MYFSIIVLMLTLCSVQNQFAQERTSPGSMKEITIKKNRHFVRWKDRIFKFRKAPQKVTWNYMFNENCKYKHADQDQFDWNKLTGLFYKWHNTRAETVMVGWRYNIPEDKIELNAYYHINKARIFTPVLLKINRGDLVRISIEIDYDQKQYTVFLNSNNKTAKHVQSFTHNNRTCQQINFYFGGQKKAPHNISVLMNEVEVNL